jgi:hypothetical protein
MRLTVSLMLTNSKGAIHGTSNYDLHYCRSDLRAVHRHRRSGHVPAAPSEFYVAGSGGVHPVVNGMATAADWMSAASFISMAGLICLHGIRRQPLSHGLDRWLRAASDACSRLTCVSSANSRCPSSLAIATTPRALRRCRRGLSASRFNHVYIIGQMTGVGVAFSRFLGRDSNDTGIYIGMAYCVLLRGVWRHEGHHLHPGGTVSAC